MTKDSLGDRMKKYEIATRTFLTPRTPVILRLDWLVDNEIPIFSKERTYIENLLTREK